GGPGGPAAQELRRDHEGSGLRQGGGSAQARSRSGAGYRRGTAKAGGRYLCHTRTPGDPAARHGGALETPCELITHLAETFEYPLLIKYLYRDKRDRTLPQACHTQVCAGTPT